MSSPKTFVIGDIHGAFNALLQCIDRSGINRESDTLICLGDVCDGWPDTFGCMEELLKFKNLIYVIGNHDQWFLQWMTENDFPEMWMWNGGQETMESYKQPPPQTHIDLLRGAKLYHTEENKVFVHAGIDPTKSLEEQDERTLVFDRGLVSRAMDNIASPEQERFTKYDELYLGHTPIHRLGFLHPIQIGEIWLMDTGAGWDGVLSIMDVNSKEYFCSDPIPSLYPEHGGRMG